MSRVADHPAAPQLRRSGVCPAAGEPDGVEFVGPAWDREVSRLPAAILVLAAFGVGATLGVWLTLLLGGSA